MDQTKTITVDGKTYELDKLSPQIQQAVAIYNRFSADLSEAQLTVIKCQAAVTSVGQQIAEAIKKADEAAPAAPAAETPSEVVPA